MLPSPFATNRLVAERSDEERLTIWLLSPYHTGSHQSWAEGYMRHSRHRIVLLGMPGRFWKWRMQGGSVELAQQARAHLADGDVPHAILATDMVNLPVWLGLLRDVLPPQIPAILYMHENQLTYPWRPGESPDLTYGMINWLSQMVADQVLFNGYFHRESWFAELPRLLKHFPDYNHLSAIDRVAKQSHVLPVGIEIPGDEERPSSIDEEPPLILWNQRWEYDKRPDRFFRLLYRLQEDGYPFRLAVAGENFRNAPAEFEEARQRLSERIIHWGYVPDKAGYRRLLRHASLVISTTDHEFFGISILEAIAAGAFPLLPDRLSYPELLPPELRPACLYSNEEELYHKAVIRLKQPRPAPPSLQRHVEDHYSWATVARRYDDFLAEFANSDRL
jgi:glycosyltransferase involved in cell wall biosynthesis